MIININGDKIEIIKKENINSGAIQYYEVELNFDESWSGLTKVVKIINVDNEEAQEIAVVDDKKIYIDAECYGRYDIGFIGYTIEGDKKTYQISTELKQFYIDMGAGEIHGSNIIPKLNEWELYIQQIKEICDGVVIDRIEKTGTNGLIDTHTIFYTNGTKYEFTVTNGYTPVKGQDYYTNEEKEEFETAILDTINSTLDSNLQEAKDYADSIKTKKTSELTNDSNFAKTDENNNFSTAQTINGTLTVNGDIVQNGESYETHAEKVYTKNDEIITREGAVGGLSEGEFSGIKAQNYDGEHDGRLGFNANGEARVGDVGDEQPLLTRDEISNLKEGQVLVWDGTKLKAVGSSDYVKNTDYVTSSTAGIVKIGTGFGIWVNANKQLYVAKASNAQIDTKTDNYYPIVPSNLNYAVGSVKASETQAGSAKMWTGENDEGEIGLYISTEV